MKNFSRFSPCSRVLQSYMNFVRGREASPLWRALIPVSWIARAWIGCMEFLFRHGLKNSLEPQIPVISVGNITYGGTNKTPFVEMLCRAMSEHGISMGIVSRGYGGSTPDVLVFQDGQGNRKIVGDEPLLLSARLPGVPVAVSRKRLKGLNALAESGVELAVADDAFQHRIMGRDVDVVLIDSTCPFGNGRLLPAGILREPTAALKRARFVVLTKIEQIDGEQLTRLRRKIAEIVPPERIFTARLSVVQWMCWDGEFSDGPADLEGRKAVAFAAIGNPDSFFSSLKHEGIDTVCTRSFRDHHLYSLSDMQELAVCLKDQNAEYLTCTEKDIYNLPDGWRPDKPLLVPRISIVIDERELFFDHLIEALRPHIVVASNGYGEDAIGVLLAKKLRDAFPDARISAFPLVGRGEPYRSAGFDIPPPPSVTPSGGVLKYRIRDLWGDIRAGLFGHIRAQLTSWKALAGTIRTPVCVGDVYLLLHTLWGQGTTPLFTATAKTVYLSGHWKIERALIRRYSRRTWTRDEQSAQQLVASGADAVYAGNPIMDLLDGQISTPHPHSPLPGEKPLVMLLPGSRIRAYTDIKMLLEAIEMLNLHISCRYIMVLAPTLDLPRLLASCKGWTFSDATGSDFIVKGNIEIKIHCDDVASAIEGVRLLIGLGGTANQLCAGMGIPVVSIDEKGKRVQKKLLGDAEILVEPNAGALCDCAFKVLTEPALHSKMSAAGIARMGSPGALDDITRYCGEQLGWEIRNRVYSRLASFKTPTSTKRRAGREGDWSPPYV